MANHGKPTRVGGRLARHRSKPSRTKRIERRWDARVAALGEYLATREYAFRVGPFVSKVWPHRNDVRRVFRIAEYLAKRAERQAIRRPLTEDRS
jgi:hypothetical protein